MTTFTRVLLNERRRGGRHLLLNPEAMHAAISAAFPPDTSKEHGRILWRVDHHKAKHEHVLYIVGPEKPTVEHIVEQAGWDTRPGQIAEYDRFIHAIQNGQQWHFELVANPTKSVPQSRGTRGKVVPLTTVNTQLNWLLENAPRHGFSVSSDDIVTARVIESHLLSFQRNPHQSRNMVRITTARFEGELTVVDAAALRHALMYGIGRARGYGCGLLTLAKRDS